MSSEGETTVDLSKTGSNKPPVVVDGPTERLPIQLKPYIEEALPSVSESRIEFTDINALFQTIGEFSKQGKNGTLELLTSQELLLNEHMLFRPRFRVHLLAKDKASIGIVFQGQLEKVEYHGRTLLYGKNEIENAKNNLGYANPNIKVVDDNTTRLTGLRSIDIEYSNSTHNILVRPNSYDDKPDTASVMERRERQEMSDLLSEAFGHITPGFSQVSKVLTMVQATNRLESPAELIVSKIDFLKKRLPPKNSLTVNSQLILLHDPTSFGRIASRWAMATTAVIEAFTLTHSNKQTLDYIRQKNDKVTLDNKNINFTSE